MVLAKSSTHRTDFGEDGDSTILILMPRKAKVHDIQAAAKLTQQLMKKASPTVLASEPDTAFPGHGSSLRHIEMKTESNISRSSSLHDAMSTTEQSDEEDEEMMTEPISSPNSSMVMDSRVEAGNASSFEPDSYTSSCRSESYDVSMDYQPAVKAEERLLGQHLWSYSDAKMQTDMPLASSNPYAMSQEASQNQALDNGSFGFGASAVFGTMSGSQTAGVCSGIPRLGYEENQMFNSWPPRMDKFSNGVSQDASANPDGSHASPYDSNQDDLGSSAHLMDEGWFQTYLDPPGHYDSNMSHPVYNDMNDTQMFCPDQLQYGNRSTAAERRQSCITGDWTSSAPV